MAARRRRQPGLRAGATRRPRRNRPCRHRRRATGDPGVTIEVIGPGRYDDADDRLARATTSSTAGPRLTTRSASCSRRASRIVGPQVHTVTITDAGEIRSGQDFVIRSGRPHHRPAASPTRPRARVPDSRARRRSPTPGRAAHPRPDPRPSQNLPNTGSERQLARPGCCWDTDLPDTGSNVGLPVVVGGGMVTTGLAGVTRQEGRHSTDRWRPVAPWLWTGLVVCLAGTDRDLGLCRLGVRRHQHRVAAPPAPAGAAAARAAGGRPQRVRVAERGDWCSVQASALVRIPRFGGSSYVMPVLEGTSDGVLAQGFGHVTDSAPPARSATTPWQRTGSPTVNRCATCRSCAGETTVAWWRRVARPTPTCSTPIRTISSSPSPPAGSSRRSRSTPTAAPPRTPPTAGRLITLTTCSELFHTDNRMVAFGHLELRAAEEAVRAATVSP